MDADKLDELERLRKAAGGRWFVGGPIGDPWQVVCMEDSDDDYALFECSAPNAALITAAINALEELVAMGKTAKAFSFVDERAVEKARKHLTDAGSTVHPIDMSTAIAVYLEEVSRAALKGT
jgi:hypothetical protein